MYRKKSQIGQILVCIIDLILILGVAVLSGMIRYGFSFALFRQAENVALLLATLSVLHVLLFFGMNIYGTLYKRSRYQEIVLSFLYNLILVAVSLFIGFTMKEEVFVSRLMMGYFFLIDTVLLCGMHIFIRNRRRIFKTGTGSKRSVMLFTEAEYVPEITEELKHQKDSLWSVIAVVLPDDADADLEEVLPDVPVMGLDETEKDYLEFAAKHVVDEVFVKYRDGFDREKIRTLVQDFEQMGVVVNVYLDDLDFGVGGSSQVDSIGRYPVVAYSSRLFDYRMVALKRLVDILGSIIGLLLTFLIGIFVAPAILIESPGPLIFKQKRVGRNGRVFNFYKFRSMYKDAEARKKELMKDNEMTGPMFKIEKDPRITKVGAFIRKTSIDELPQFWNVLKGDMSLVGTRPPTLDEYMQYSPYQKRRISFRPGITGLWQVSGRSDIKDFEEVVRLDLEYIDKWSIWLDTKIIFKTIRMVFSRKNGAK